MKHNLVHAVDLSRDPVGILFALFAFRTLSFGCCQILLLLLLRIVVPDLRERQSAASASRVEKAMPCTVPHVQTGRNLANMNMARQGLP
jgi:hypothetical protein